MALCLVSIPLVLNTGYVGLNLEEWDENSIAILSRACLRWFWDVEGYHPSGELESLPVGRVRDVLAGCVIRLWAPTGQTIDDESAKA